MKLKISTISLTSNLMMIFWAFELKVKLSPSPRIQNTATKELDIQCSRRKSEFGLDKRPHISSLSSKVLIHIISYVLSIKKPKGGGHSQVIGQQSRVQQPNKY